MALILSVDVGTSKLLTAVVDADIGKAVAVREKPNDATLADQPAGTFEQDAHRILHRCEAMSAELLGSMAPDTAGRIEAIALTGQMHGLLMVDEACEPLTPLITWRDHRAATADAAGLIRCVYADWLDAGAPHRLGANLQLGYGGATLAWLAERDRIPSGATALSITDFLAAAWTGRLATEPTMAASWCLLNLARLDWDEPTLAALNIPRRVLPKILPTAWPVAPLLPGPAERMGLSAGTPVCAGMGDNQAGVVGALSDAPGKAAKVNIGTGSHISVPVATPAKLPGLECRPMPGGGFAQIGASLCGGWAYAYFRRFFQDICDVLGRPAPDDAETYAAMNALAAGAEPGSEGLRVDPRFAGSRDAVSARGAITGIDTHNLTPANLARAVLEGIAAELTDFASRLPADAFDHVVATGSAIDRNPLMLDILARSLGKPVTAATAQQATAVGAALAVAQAMIE